MTQADAFEELKNFRVALESDGKYHFHQPVQPIVRFPDLPQSFKLDAIVVLDSDGVPALRKESVVTRPSVVAIFKVNFERALFRGHLIGDLFGQQALRWQECGF